ncbi:uncharacterized protein [Physcomitrium patens]|uniref:uncharacterized protein isoform X1 n=1 Tax=Physcomitrium patens TaxID=3218 RepID=UPI000D16C4ED|nr:uncharacterized protein LOC112293483 [Physcomitrium patens]|eukprot:XP_024398722.1 uncharacterized protein LOC112293483 [Physcomitrella patens]
MWKEKTGIMCVIVAGAKAGLWRTIRFKPAVRSTSIVTLNRSVLRLPPLPSGGGRKVLWGLSFCLDMFVTSVENRRRVYDRLLWRDPRMILSWSTSGLQLAKFL